jgi:LEA14-like dessication related protein
MVRRVLLPLSVLFLGACALFGLQEPLSVTVANLTPIEVGLLEQRYALKVRLLNPNDTDITFDGVVFDLEINGKPFAKGVSSQSSVIPRFGEALIDVQVVSGIQHIIRQINELTKANRTSVTYRIKGRLHTGGFPGSIGFDSSGEFTFPTAPGKTNN